MFIFDFIDNFLQICQLGVTSFMILLLPTSLLKTNSLNFPIGLILYRLWRRHPLTSLRARVTSGNTSALALCHHCRDWLRLRTQDLWWEKKGFWRLVGKLIGFRCKPLHSHRSECRISHLYSVILSLTFCSSRFIWLWSCTKDQARYRWPKIPPN